MKAVVVYESMYGNTHLVAQAIAEGLGVDDTEVLPVGGANQAVITDADLVVVGGPTHIHGMVRPSTRNSAIEAAHQADSGLHVDPDAAGPILREWLERIDGHGTKSAAFDTRIDVPLSGRASKGISHKLRHQGFEVVAKPVSFFVDKENHLKPDAEDLAREWGRELAETVQIDHPR